MTGFEKEVLLTALADLEAAVEKRKQSLRGIVSGTPLWGEIDVQVERVRALTRDVSVAGS